MSDEGKGLLRLMALALVFLAICLGALWKIRILEKHIRDLENAPADTVTVVKVDTLLYDNPQLIAKYESDKEKVAIEVRRLKKQLAEALNMPVDTLEIHDTTTQLVFLPREYMVYKDSTYRAVVSGVQPRLDSIEVYQRNTVQTVTKTIRVPDRKRWGLGVQAGYGYDGKRLTPYVGIGVQYDILRW